MESSEKSKGSQIDRREFLGTLAAITGGALATAISPKLLAADERGSSGDSAPAPSPKSIGNGRLETVNGWYVQEGKAIWGYAQFNHWWGGYRGEPHGWYSDEGLSPSLIRNDPGRIGLNRTEDFSKLTDCMLRWGYPGFEHTPPLWYDRRRDTHSRVPQTNANVVAPFLEMPWARTDRGQACDGLHLYDLTQFNGWYFERVKQFADLCDQKGVILFFNFYNQHNLLETPAHYIDYPWRPANCIQATGLPETTPAANVFYDVSNPLRRQLHQSYIRHCLDNLRDNRNVVLLTGFEYTGPLSFMQFWFDTILEWEQSAGRQMHIGLVGTKDVVDAMLEDPKYGPRVGTIYTRYWFFNKDGTLNAPKGGTEVPGRFANKAEEMTPSQFYRHTKEYRVRYPEKAVVNLLGVDQEQTLAFLMAGGSMLVRGMDYATEYPPDYEMPLGCDRILPVYNFIRNYLSSDLLRMRPLDIITVNPEEPKPAPDKEEPVAWVLGEPGESYLIYMPAGNHYFSLDLSNAPGVFDAKWVGMRLGYVFPFTNRPPDEKSAEVRAYGGKMEGGKVVELAGLDQQPWMLWLKRRV